MYLRDGTSMVHGGPDLDQELLHSARPRRMSQGPVLALALVPGGRRSVWEFHTESSHLVSSFLFLLRSIATRSLRLTFHSASMTAHGQRPPVSLGWEAVHLSFLNLPACNAHDAALLSRIGPRGLCRGRVTAPSGITDDCSAPGQGCGFSRHS